MAWSSQPGFAQDSLPKGWVWPPWCLDRERPTIEVCVIDEDRGQGVWVEAIPKSRIEDEFGDSYLCAEYIWRGDACVDDFGPHRVRKRGSIMSVHAACSRNSRPSTSPPVVLAGAGGGLNITMPAPADSMRRQSNGHGYDLNITVAAPRKAKDQDSGTCFGAAASGHLLAEVILECVRADGIDVSRLPLGQRAIAFPGDAGSVVVGRAHQPQFFERLVSTTELLACISREHFELSWEPEVASLVLRKLSRNMLLINASPAGEGDAVMLRDGDTLGFTGLSDSEMNFLVVRVTLRTRGSVDADGAHPAVLITKQQQGVLAKQLTPALTSQMGAAAVLVCTYASRADVKKLPQEAKTIAVPIGETLQIGRQHQLGVFEQLLRADPQALAFISRTHCQVQLRRASKCSLAVFNLSANVVHVAGKPVPKGSNAILDEGGSLTFVAAIDGTTQMRLVEFMLRRMRMVGASAA